MGVIKVVKAYKQFKTKSDSKVVLNDFHMNVAIGSM